METEISDKELTQIREQMLKFATLQVNNPVLAEDLVQESFLSAFNNLEHFKRQAAFKTWVFAILKNKIIDFLRQKGKLMKNKPIISLMKVDTGKLNIPHLILNRARVRSIPKSFG